MKITILYGTESGNSELVAEEVGESIEDSDAFGGESVEVEILDMNDADLDCFDTSALHLVICSTHGEGELPSGAMPFAALLDSESPDLAGIRYAVFGLGDSSYDIYSQGSELIDQRLAALGAVRIGEYGRHDASSRDMPSDLAIAWAEEIVLAEVAALAA